jgi:hypothetical protein
VGHIFAPAPIIRVQFRAMKAITLLLLVALILTGCDHEDRIAKLEKQTKEMQSDKDRLADYDLQAKCAKDARAWFNENWSRDKDTQLLNFTNHYNKKKNKCFIEVEYHYQSNLAGPGGNSWTNDMSVWDVYENSKYANFSENHYMYFKPKISSNSEVITCDVSGKKCSSVAEFNSLSGQFMSDYP